MTEKRSSNKKSIKWRFEELTKKSTLRNPNVDIEVFRKFNITEVLVREVIQNSLDARRGGKKLIINFTFGKAEEVKEYFKTLLPHLKADKLPRREEKILPRQKFFRFGKLIKEKNQIPVLIIEDFGTTGLNGEISRGPPSGSNFDSFWRGEGISGKKGEKAGRWGYGKTTIPMASQIRSFLGLTRRYDDKRKLLMGKAFLRPHETEKGKYDYTGWFTEEDFGNPVSDRRILKDFRKKFPMNRSNKPGLSLIIPQPVPEISYESIIRAVIIHYFFPILDGEMTVEIKGHEENLILNKDSILEIALSEDWSWDGTTWEKFEDKYIEERLKFTNKAVEMLKNGKIFNFPDSVGENYKITEDSFQGKLDELRERFRKNGMLGFRIPVKINPEGGEAEISTFQIFLKKYPREELSSSDEFYIRSEIRLPEETQKMRNLPVRGMLIARKKPVSEFLGDAEVPAHTRWKENREGFSDDYKLHAKTLRFIRNSMAEISRILNQELEEKYNEALKHIFSVPRGEKGEESGEERKKDMEAKEDREKSGEEKDTRKSRKGSQVIKPFQIHKTKDGFKITLKEGRKETPISGVLRVAYDVHRGNPFRKYGPEDFRLKSDSINGEKCRIEEIKENGLSFTMLDPESSMTLTGFDPTRDLIIDLSGVKKE